LGVVRQETGAQGDLRTRRINININNVAVIIVVIIIPAVIIIIINLYRNTETN